MSTDDEVLHVCGMEHRILRNLSIRDEFKKPDLTYEDVFFLSQEIEPSRFIGQGGLLFDMYL